MEKKTAPLVKEFGMDCVPLKLLPTDQFINGDTPNSCKMPYSSTMKLIITILVLCSVGLCCGQTSGSTGSSRTSQGEQVSQNSLRASFYTSDLTDNPYVMALMMSRMMGTQSPRNLYSNLPMMMLLGGNGLDILPTDNLWSLLLMQSLFEPVPRMPVTNLPFMLTNLATGTSDGMGKSASPTSSP